MKITLLNSEQVKDLFKSWGNTSAVCYSSKSLSELTDDDFEKIGKGCMYSGHNSGSRGDFFKFYIEDVPRFMVDQAVRHEQGCFKNVGSFRYIDKGSFCYEVPVEIKDNEVLLERYIQHMDQTAILYELIKNYVAEKTGSKERANEQARYVLPMSTKTAFVMGFTFEALVHFCQERLCVRAEDIIRQLAVAIKKEVINVVPELNTRLVPKCEFLLYCPEGKKSCGARPTKKEVKEKLAQLNFNSKKEVEVLNQKDPEPFRLCPMCGKLTSYNSYFQSYECKECGHSFKN